MKNTIHNFITGNGENAFALQRLRFRIFAVLLYVFAVIYAIVSFAPHNNLWVTIGLCMLLVVSAAFIAWFIGARILEPQMRRVQAAEEKEQALLASIGEGVIASDEHGRAILVNAAAERMLGWTSSELLGKPLMDVIRIHDEKGNAISLEKRPLQRAIGSMKPFTTSTTSPFYYTRKDGTQFPAAITATPVMQNNRVVGAIDIFRDITTEKDIDIAKSTFVSLASHQLRTPLTAIRWTLETLQMEARDNLNKTQNEFLDNALYSTKQLVGLVRELLNISRIDTGRMSVNPEPTSLQALTREVLREVEQERAQKSIRIITKLPRTIPQVRVDPILIRQVILNFLTNALKYTPSGSTVRLTCVKEQHHVRFSVADSGIGIPVAEQGHIFERFYRASNARSHKENGSGLGLYLAKMLIQMSGGTIGFTTTEGQGSTFWFTLPLRGSKKRAGEMTIDTSR